MATHVSFRNQYTGEIKSVKVGWSWTLFLFSNVFGIPLFLRKLYSYGFLLLGLSCVQFVLGVIDDPSLNTISKAISFGQLIAAVYLGRNGNQMTAKNYLENGWEWAEPGDDATIYAQEKWALA